MLVGDVRDAMIGVGISWKLSGGSQCSSAVTNTSKKCQVLRAVPRRKPSCERESVGMAGPMGRLTHQAIHGEANQAPSTRKAVGQIRRAAWELGHQIRLELSCRGRSRHGFPLPVG